MRSCAVFQPFEADHQDVGVLPDRDDAGEIVRGVVGQVRHDPRRHRVRRGVGENGVAVRLGAHDLADADRAAGAAVVLHRDRLAEFLGQRVEHRARHDVGGAAGAERDVGPDRLRGPSLGLGRERQGKTKRDQSAPAGEYL